MVEIGQIPIRGLLTQTKLKEILYYNKDTGIFNWLIKPSKNRDITDKVGCLNSLGYITIRLNNKNYSAHRLAWLYHYGEWPSKIIDHIDTIRHHNWIDNLRDVAHFENIQNRKVCNSNNTSGLLGVYLDKRREKYVSEIWNMGIKKYLGSFNTPEEAHQAYLIAKRELHSTCTI